MAKLNDFKILKDLSEHDAKEITPYINRKEFAKKDTIFSEGDPSEWFYLVETGKVKITKLSQEGKELIIEIIHPGDFFGGIAVVRGFPYPAHAVAMEDTKTVRISKNNMLKILDRFPDLMMKIVQSIGDRLKDSHETTKNIALEKVGSRIASLLLKLSEKSGHETGDGIEIDMKLTKQDIAEMVGTTVETSIRTMSLFKKSGLISEKQGKIIIKDRDGLSERGL